MSKQIREMTEHCFDVVPDSKDMRDFVKLILHEVLYVFEQQLKEARHNDKVHLGLGDVRYTIGMEQDFEDMLKKHFGVK